MARRLQSDGTRFEVVLDLCGDLDDAKESTSYGTPAVKVRGKLLARLKEDGETLVVFVEPEERDALLAADPSTFFTTDHYLGSPTVLVRLRKIRREDLRRLLKHSHAFVAPKRRAKRKAAGRPRSG